MKNAIIAASLALGLSACTQVSPLLTSDNQRLSQLSTYQWDAQALSQAQTQGYRIADMEQTITDHVDSIMSAKGYQRVASNADFRLDYRVLIEEKTTAKQDKTSVSENDQAANEFGLRWRFNDKIGNGEVEGLGKQQESLITYENGTMHVAAVDAAGNTLWHAKSVRTLNSRGNEAERRAQLRIGLDQALKSLPAKAAQ